MRSGPIDLDPLANCLAEAISTKPVATTQLGLPWACESGLPEKNAQMIKMSGTFPWKIIRRPAKIAVTPTIRWVFLTIPVYRNGRRDAIIAHAVVAVVSVTDCELATDRV